MESIPRKRQKTPQAICGSDLKQLSSNTNRRNFTLITTDVMVYSENILTEEKISESGFSIHKNDLQCFWWKLAPTSFSCTYAFIPTIALTQGNQWWHTSCCIALPGWTGKKAFLYWMLGLWDTEQVHHSTAVTQGVSWEDSSHSKAWVGKDLTDYLVPASAHRISEHRHLMYLAQRGQNASHSDYTGH